MKTKKMFAAAAVCAASAMALTCSAGALEVSVRDGADSMSCISYEVNNEAWAHLINPYNEISLYSPTSASDFSGSSRDIIVCFDVTGVEQPFSVFPGYQVYGDDTDDGELLSIWSQDDYVRYCGEEYTFVVDGDGSYELIVPLKYMADSALDFWGENIYNVSILELALVGAGNDDLDGFINENMTITFTGIKESEESHTLAECSRTGSETAAAEESDESSAEAAADGAGDTETAAQPDKGAPDTGVTGVTAAAGALVLAAGAVIAVGKRGK